MWKDTSSHLLTVSIDAPTFVILILKPSMAKMLLQASFMNKDNLSSDKKNDQVPSQLTLTSNLRHNAAATDHTGDASHGNSSKPRLVTIIVTKTTKV